MKTRDENDRESYVRGKGEGGDKKGREESIKRIHWSDLVTKIAAKKTFFEFEMTLINKENNNRFNIESKRKKNTHNKIQFGPRENTKNVEAKTLARPHEFNVYR